MCGICYAPEVNREQVLNEFIRSHLDTENEFNMLIESVGHTELITSTARKLLFNSIKNKDQHTLIRMSNAENREKLNELALIKTHMWLGRQSLKVFIKPHFFSSELNDKIKSFAMEWVPHSGVVFDFVDNQSADIIIEINGNSIHNSMIGKDAIPLSKTGKATMNLGLGQVMSDSEFKRVVLHEFGHALGCIHEHQSPMGTIDWNEQVVIRTMRSLAGWDEATIRKNILNKYQSGTITNSKFDQESIMIYPIYREWTKDGTEIGWNSELSVGDKEFIQKAYSIK
jgi:hypothetical protein